MKIIVISILSFLTATFSYSQSFEGVWDTGKDNTMIEFVIEDGQWIGKIKSSDNDKAPIGKVILKDLEKDGDSWKGKLFVIKKQKWVNASLSPIESKMELLVKKGFSKKKVEWVKVE